MEGRNAQLKMNVVVVLPVVGGYSLKRLRYSCCMILFWLWKDKKDGFVVHVSKPMEENSQQIGSQLRGTEEGIDLRSKGQFYANTLV